MKARLFTFALLACWIPSAFAGLTILSTTVNATGPISGLATVHSFDSGTYGIGSGSLSGIFNVERHDVYVAAASVSNDISFDQYDIKFFSTTPLLVTLASVSAPELRITNSGANVGASGMSSTASAGAALYQNGGNPVAVAVEGGSLSTYGYGNLPPGTSAASSFVVAPYVNYDFITYVVSQVSLDGTNLFHNSAYSIEGGGPSGHSPVTGSLHYQALPEPCSMVTLAIGALVAIRRKRSTC